MMKLSTMWNVVQTLHTSRLLETVLAPWDFDPGSIRFVRASANFVAHFTREGRTCFLRFNDVAERPRPALEAEARLLQWLAAAGVPVAAPIPSRQGRLVETIATAHGAFHALVFVGLEGAHLEADECSLEQFTAWGRALGRLHAALKQYADPSAVNRPTWRDHLDQARPYVAGHAKLEVEWERLRRHAEALPTDPDHFGIIHYDFESDNLCWQGGDFAALDFDDCAHFWYAADIAYALRDILVDGVNPDDARLQAFLAGYGAAPLLDELPLFLRLGDMYRFARLSRALDLAPDAELPQWLRDLEAKLRGRVEGYRTSL